MSHFVWDGIVESSASSSRSQLSDRSGGRHTSQRAGGGRQSSHIRDQVQFLSNSSSAATSTLRSVVSDGGDHAGGDRGGAGPSSSHQVVHQGGDTDFSDSDGAWGTDNGDDGWDADGPDLGDDADLDRAGGGQSRMSIKAFIEWAGQDSLWSKGSAHHTTGKCRPCHYFHTASGCQSGAECRFCHLPHTQKGRASTKRLQCKKLAESLEARFSNDPEALKLGMELLGCHSTYLKNLLAKVLEAQDLPGRSKERRNPVILSL